MRWLVLAGEVRLPEDAEWQRLYEDLSGDEMRRILDAICRVNEPLLPSALKQAEDTVSLWTDLDPATWLPKSSDERHGDVVEIAARLLLDTVALAIARATYSEDDE